MSHVGELGSPRLSVIDWASKNHVDFEFLLFIWDYASQNYHGSVNFESLRKDIKRHEDNLKFLKSQANHLDEYILDLQGAANENGALHPEDKLIEQILHQERSAAGILCKVKSYHAMQASNLSWTKDVLGIVATLARVDNDNLSRLLSEYLGLETMLGIVCKTFDGIKALEKYDREGKINSIAGLHGLGSSIGRKIDGRFTAICVEDLRHKPHLLPNTGGFMANDPQKKLALLKPKLLNGKCPSGFIDFAVNMVILDDRNLFCVTASGHGLRETLFYNLFSYLQVYNTRTDMLSALPCITHGALSLDGGMIKKNGLFVLGSRENFEVKFPVISSRPDLFSNYSQIEDGIRKLRWQQHHIEQDMLREQQLLDKARAVSSGKLQA
ncbi:unnamed protein product [Dovyalis caffra]|uniref:Uncharacterized protein n=1 Tax=Dovyalis caffra TaxID=77055 RepID=A0AAV1SFT5_9ROSI|nr:unnamed protein product [Dovyalis caffra]